MNIRTKIAALGAAIVFSMSGTAAASAADNGGETNPQTVTINGHVLGPEDGLVVTNESYVVAPGGGQVGSWYGPTAGEISPRTVWGNSFAYSVEQIQLGYVGYAYAAANIYNGQRMVQVCFNYTRGGVMVTPNVCSTASFNGGWNAGAETTYGLSDSLNPWAPQTIFNISTVRIDPTAHW